jgi:hypothetical protein
VTAFKREGIPMDKPTADVADHLRSAISGTRGTVLVALLPCNAVTSTSLWIGLYGIDVVERARCIKR